MPTYGYRCHTCDVDHIIVHSMTDEQPRFCTNCGSELARIPGISGVSFKGSGWGGNHPSQSKRD